MRVNINHSFSSKDFVSQCLSRVHPKRKEKQHLNVGVLYSRETANKKMNHSCNELFKKAEKISINELTDGSTLQRNVRCFQKLFDELLYSRGKKQAENLQPSFEKLRIEN